MNDFTTGNPTRQIIAFSLPMLIGNVFQQVYSMVDAMVVGQFVGGEALAAVGVSMYIINFLISFLIGLTTGASVLISQFFGARQPDKLSRTVSTSIVFMGVLGVFLSVVGFAGTPLFLRLMNTPPEIFADAQTYMRIIIAGMIFPLYYNMYTAYMRALGDSRNPLYILIFSTILNTALDVWFVAGLDWGVAGAAWATILSQSVSAVLCYFYAGWRTPLLRVERLLFDRSLMGSILRYSVPAAVQLSVVSLAQLTIARLVNGFGSVAVAGYTAAVKIDQFATMPVSNLSMATATFVGQNMGAGLEDRAKRGLRSSLLFAMGVNIAVTAIALLFGETLIGLFVDSADPNYTEIIRYGRSYLAVVAIFYVLFATFFAFNGFFRGVGDAVIVMILTITSLVIRNISAYALNHFLGMELEAIALSIPIGWALCSVFCVFYYRARLWDGKMAVRTAAPKPDDT